MDRRPILDQFQIGFRQNRQIQRILHNPRCLTEKVEKGVFFRPNRATTNPMF